MTEGGKTAIGCLCVESEPNQRQDNWSIGQVRTCQIQTSQHHPWQDLEALGH